MCRLDLDDCTTFSETPVKRARREHKCDCCDGPIKVGDPYLRHFSVCDGSVTSEKQCTACTAMVQEFTRVHGQYTNPSYMPQLLYDCIANELDDGNTEMVEKWRAEIKAMRQRSGKPQEDEDDDEGDEEEDDDEGGAEGEAQEEGNDQGR